MHYPKYSISNNGYNISQIAQIKCLPTKVIMSKAELIRQRKLYLKEVLSNQERRLLCS